MEQPQMHSTGTFNGKKTQKNYNLVGSCRGSKSSKQFKRGQNHTDSWGTWILNF